MSKSLFDVDGNYVGEGGQGFMTQPGVDPTGGGHATVVSAGVEKLEDEVAAGNGVAAVKPNLVGWNGWKPVEEKVQPQAAESSNGGQSVEGVAAPAEKKVEIPRREDRPAAYPTKARRDADAAASVGQELTDEQKAAVQNAGATPSPLSAAEQEAEKKDIEAEKSDTLNVAQLQGEKELNPESSNTGADNGGQSPTAANGGQDNGGQSVVPKTEETKASGTNPKEYTPEYIDSGINDDDYQAAKKRKEAAEAKGEIADWDDVETVFRKENRYMKEPELPKLEEFVPSAPPALKSIDSSYRTAYSIMQERLKAAGDDPASKAKRAKARRAEKLVAALGDLLQVAANMWGVARGANSAKLSSISAGVSKRHAAEDALALKREAQYAKDFERAVTRNQALTKEQNEYSRALWKAAEDARKYNTSEKNKALQRQYEMRKQIVTQHNAQVDRDFHQEMVSHERKLQSRINHRYRKDEATHRGNISRANNDHTTANRIRVKQTASYKELYKDE